MRAAVRPLVLKSSEWERVSFALYEGEIAWEITLSGAWRMLRGDGEAVNGGHGGGYTRLRVSADSQTVSVVNFPEGVIWLDSVPTRGDLPSSGLDLAVRYLCKVESEKTVYERPVGLEDWRPLELPQQTITVQQAFEAAFAAFYKLKEETSQDLRAARADAERELGAVKEAAVKEREEREDGDKQLSDRIEKEELDRKHTDIVLTKALYKERGRRAGADNCLARQLYRLKSGVKDIDQKFDDYALLHSPQFTGEPETPDPFLEEDGVTPKQRLNFNQAVPLKTWKTLYDLTLESAGAYLRVADNVDITAGGADTQIVYERRVDTEPEVTARGSLLREVDHEGVARPSQMSILWDVVMTTFGGSFRKADMEAAQSGVDVVRLVDRVDGRVEFRVTDEQRGGEKDIQWVEI